MSVGAPELLVRLDTSALENRLNVLTDQCEGQVRGLRNKIEDCTADVRTVVADVAAIQHFLLSYHNKAMSTALSAATDGSGAAPADSLESSATPSMEATSTENLLKMVTIARRLLEENEALRSSLDRATSTLALYNSTQESLQREVARLRELTAQQSEQLQNLSDWLGVSGLSMSADAAQVESNEVRGTSSRTDCTHAPPAEAPTQSTEALLSRSPLLLSFRRFLLRDLTERLTSVVEQQSRDFHDSIAHLEGRVISGHSVVMGGDAQQTGDINGNLFETVRTLTKRVREIDQRAVKREEFTSLMRSKADSLLLPVKADSAAVSEMERRLATRCSELEERCAYADAERAEFRAILRSLIAAQTTVGNNGGNGAARPSGRTSPDTSTYTVAGVPGVATGGSYQRGAALRDVLPVLSGGGGVNGAAAASNAVPTQRLQPSNTPPGAAPSSSPTSSTPLPQPQQQQLYRVVGTSQGLGVYGLPAGAAGPVSNGGAASRDAVSTTANAISTRREPAHSRSMPAKGVEECTVAIGLTTSQSDYANYVSQQLSRRQIGALPTLPYERMTNTQ